MLLSAFYLQVAKERFRQHRTAMAGAVFLCIVIVGTTIGPLIYPTPMNRIDFSQAMLPPGWAHPFGTNDLGQDILARMLWGGRVSLAVGMLSMLVAVSVGTLVGALAGFYGGWLDMLLMRLTDLCLSLPPLPLLLLIIFLFREPATSALGAEVGVFVLVVLVTGGLNWMPVARLVRASFLSVREMDFITAARASGVPPLRLMWRHMLPNVLGPVIVAATLSVGMAIITESTLSFLGLGFPPDVPTWGRMLYDAQHFVDIAPSMVLFPGMAIFLTVLSINYLGDGLRDALGSL